MSPLSNAQQIEAEQNPEISAQYPVKSVPTFVALQHGTMQEVLEGANAPGVVALVKRLQAPTVYSLCFSPCRILTIFSLFLLGGVCK